MKFLLLTLVFYLVLRFVLRIVLPAVKLGRMANSRMREMQQKMEEMQQQAQNPAPGKPKVVDGDYIDYEEIK
jgi:hypothetical protein